MTAWTPALAEPDSLRTAIGDLARHVLMPEVIAAGGAVHLEDAWHVTLPDGRRAVIALDIRLRSERRWGSRAALVYDLSGRAVAEQDGFLLEGLVAIDQKTRAFLHLDCQLRPTH